MFSSDSAGLESFIKSLLVVAARTPAPLWLFGLENLKVGFCRPYATAPLHLPVACNIAKWCLTSPVRYTYNR